ncbi:hypothetical protein, partial [Immundisolibacter sp.]|uniref:hypothetical protein n=1 Tax=Immundisolibacter sp. TaxID=1934948 RepID=UPI0025BFF2E9
AFAGAAQPQCVLREPKTRNTRLKRVHLPNPHPKTGRFSPSSVTRWRRHVHGAGFGGLISDSLGGRSRNGWGSFCLTPSEPQGAFAAGHALPLRPWRDCLDRDWPHAIGCDQKGPLIWQTASHQDWRSLMKTLAVIKVGLRTQFVFPDVKPPHTDIESRHWLSYPIATHRTRKWGNGMRLPNQLYFKIRQSDGGNIVGAIFHIPHLPPPAFCPDHKAVERTWEQVHALLDHINSGSPRTYPMIPDDAPARRRSALKPHIDTVTLERIAE